MGQPGAAVQAGWPGWCPAPGSGGGCAGPARYIWTLENSGAALSRAAGAEDRQRRHARSAAGTSRSVHTATVSAHYRTPGWFTRNVFNRAVTFLTQRGVTVLGSRVLAVRGRTSGVWRTTPVNLLDHDGRRYLVSARGEGQWVRNLRAAGTGELRVGRRTEAFRGRELSDDEKVPVLRAYLKRWKTEVGAFFDGVGPNSRDAEIQAIAGKHPAFEVLPAD